MNLELQIPEEVAHLLTSKYADLPRAAVEALALEGLDCSGSSMARTASAQLPA